jgi:uncharacterized protein YqgC (DUF456 family)
MEIALAIVGVIVLILGFIGCFLPVLPGPPLAYISLLLMQMGPEKPFTTRFLLLVGAIVLLVTILDYMIPAWGTKKWGGSRYGMAGAIAGIFVGIFVLPPVGFFIFPLLGAIVGEILSGANTKKAFRSAFGTMIGLLLGTIIKFSVTAFIAFHFFINLKF